VSGSVSVVIPAFNAAGYIGAALESVLQQRSGEQQVIVVDDGSTDDTPRILAGFGARITVVRQENRGPAAARNAGLDLSEGEFITFIDADDLWPHGRLDGHLAYLRSHPGTEVLLGAIQHVRDVDGGWEPYGEPFHAMSLPSGIFRRDLFLSVGRLDESLFYCEDVDWFFRARRAGVALAKTPEIGLYHRRHRHNLTNRKSRVREHTLKVLARHRRAGATG